MDMSTHRNGRVVWMLAAGLLLVPALQAAAPSRKGELYVTAKNTGDRLTKKESLTFETMPQPDENYPTVLIDPRKTFQTFEGIGGALTDSAAETYAKLPADKQKELLTAYFDGDKGIGYTLCRTNIHSCDFSSGSYTYAEVAGDKELKHFSVDHDKTYRIPFIKAALETAKASQGSPFKLYASPWSPPAWMKTNGTMLKGGQLKPEYARTWAKYYGKFVKAYAKEGIPMWGLTVQNEPMATQTWESCIFTGEEERDFVKNHLGPQLAKDGLGKLKLMIWDHNRGLVYQRAKAVYDDPQAAKYVWGTSFHWYVGDHFDNVRQVHDAWPDKKLAFSEGCAERFDAAKISEWQWGEKYGTSLLHDLRNWSVVWTDWNVLLDERGGPNHVGNFCYAPVHADTKTGALTYMNSYYYIGHFSKFIRPGAKRVAATTNDDKLLTTAFKNPDGKLAIVVLNLQDEDIPCKIWIDGQVTKTTSPARSIMTVKY
jgi:glucosylceramidase